MKRNAIIPEEQSDSSIEKHAVELKDPNEQEPQTSHVDVTSQMKKRMMNFLEELAEQEVNSKSNPESLTVNDNNIKDKNDNKNESMSKTTMLGTMINLTVDNRMREEDEKSAQFKHVFWIDGKCIVNPEHVARQTWDIGFVLTSLIYTALRVPYAIGFDIDEFAEVDNAWFALNRLVDFIFIVDMCLIFMTAKKDGRVLITDHKLSFKKTKTKQTTKFAIVIL